MRLSERVAKVEIAIRFQPAMYGGGLPGVDTREHVSCRGTLVRLSR